MVAELGPPRRFSVSRDEVVVGSAPDADLVLDKPGVAQHHIRIAMRNRVVMIEDLRRTNRPPRAVEPTDIIRIASIKLQVAPDLSDGIDDGLRLLGEIRQRPDDPVPRTVYADWCEEHGHPERAEFLRQQLAVGKAKSASDPDFVRAAARLAALAPEVGQTWRAHVAMAFIERCPMPRRTPLEDRPPDFGMELVCPMRWDKLAPTDREGVRSCSGCHREVTYCTTIEQARTIAQQGGCIAVDLATARAPYDLTVGTPRGRHDFDSMPVLGRPSPRRLGD